MKKFIGIILFILVFTAIVVFWWFAYQYGLSQRVV